MKTRKKQKRMFVLHPETLEALDRLVPAGERSEFVDRLIARQLGVERDVLKIIEKRF